jgi:hypothetical protein
MSAELITFFATLIGTLIGVVATGLLDKYDVIHMFRRSKLNVTGKWHGWSLYIPLEGYFYRDHEAVYRVEAEFKQTGRRIQFTETLTAIYNLYGKRLKDKSPREIIGSGQMVGEADLTLTSREKSSLTNAALYLMTNTFGDEIRGVIAVTSPTIGRPVAVRLLLRRINKEMPSLDELGIEKIRTLVEPVRDEPWLIG